MADGTYGKNNQENHKIKCLLQLLFSSSGALSLLHHLPVSSLSVCLCWLSSSHGAGKENVNYSSVPKKRRGGGLILI